MILGLSGLLQIYSGATWPLLTLCRPCATCTARGKNLGCVFWKAMAPTPSPNLRRNYHRSSAAAWYNGGFLFSIAASMRLCRNRTPLFYRTQKNDKKKKQHASIIAKVEASLHKVFVKNTIALKLY